MRRRTRHGSDWRGYHLRVIEQEYRRAPYFAEVFPLVRGVYAGDHADAGRLQPRSARDRFCDYLGYRDARFVGHSILPHAGDNTDRLIQLTTAVGGDEHITSTWGTDRRYIDWDRVADAGITVRTQEFVAPDLPPAVRAVRAQPGRAGSDLRRGPGGCELDFPIE